MPEVIEILANTRCLLQQVLYFNQFNNTQRDTSTFFSIIIRIAYQYRVYTIACMRSLVLYIITIDDHIRKYIQFFQQHGN